MMDEEYHKEFPDGKEAGDIKIIGYMDLEDPWEDKADYPSYYQANQKTAFVEDSSSSESEQEPSVDREVPHPDS